jgi:hypothetical protein
MPPLLKSDKLDHDMEFEWLLCLASRRQTSQRLRSTEVGGIQRPEEFPALTFHREPERALILDRKYPNHEARKRSVSVLK